MKITISILLVLIPLLSWILQYFFSKRNSMMTSFKKHWTCYYGDWIFVFINFFFIYSVHLSDWSYLFLLISFLLNLTIHRIWGKENRIKKTNGHFFHKGTEKLGNAGIVHLVFSTIELAVIMAIFFFPPIFPFIFVELFLALVFGILIIYGSKRIHTDVYDSKKNNSKVYKLDRIIGGVLITSVLVKFIFLVR